MAEGDWPAVELRRYADRDLGLTIALETDPEVMSELGGPQPVERAERAHRIRLDERWWYAIALEPDGPGIGQIGIFERAHDGQTIHELGWSILRAHQGKGVGTRALALVLEVARAVPEIQRLHAFPSVTNGPSNALCRRFGFHLVGRENGDFRGRRLRLNHWVLDETGV